MTGATRSAPAPTMRTPGSAARPASSWSRSGPRRCVFGIAPNVSAISRASASATAAATDSVPARCPALLRATELLGGEGKIVADGQDARPGQAAELMAGQRDQVGVAGQVHAPRRLDGVDVHAGPGLRGPGR